MKFSIKAKYALSAILDIAIYSDQGPMTVESIAARQSIPQRYLERLTGLMRSGGLLKSIKGPGGGYVLGHPIQNICILDVFQAINEEMDSTMCKGKANCHAGHICLTHPVWDELNHRLTDYFQSVSLADLINSPKIKEIIGTMHEKTNLF